ncbi:hypothetical protein [Aphanothece sacrum]|uniref:Uncharacterized protein n=1 Tax=Aphanothece sacrum FPU1 TaxID=1920663 RepID=A0A401ICS3_APHSA|nr:hypothetical protein [Aphanothece sacrum]GBF79044.1 hypothetical protein AsFPU1_0436 [Aphanothece sacrum FPU1]GBF86077.1 hypothetical protein AsFPU3_3147 [Aphanothece sacrum FPU3]
MTQTRKDQYFALIDQLIRCPNGQEPDVLTANSELLDADFIQSLMQVATMMAHENNPDGAKFLIYIARQLSKELGLYPEVANQIS